MQRRRFLAGATAAIWLPCRAAADAGGKVYARDIDFLLAEFEKQAGHFFEAKKIDWPAVTRDFREAVKGVASDTGKPHAAGGLPNAAHAGIHEKKFYLCLARGR